MSSVLLMYISYFPNIYIVTIFLMAFLHLFQYTILKCFIYFEIIVFLKPEWILYTFTGREGKTGANRFDDEVKRGKKK